MSRITGNDAKGLMEAYQEVYAPQELTEEQVWEEVENWVNSLLEEGYDLSEYTWEEMYENYIEEQGGQRGSGSSASQTNQSVRIPGSRTATRLASDLGSSLSASTRVPTSSGPRNVRGGGSRPAASPAPAAPGPARVGMKLDTGRFDRERERLKGVGNPPTASASAATSPTRTPAAAARPSATPTSTKTAPTRPAAPAKPAGSAMDQWAKANPKLAAASAEKARIRGTQQTDNPLMKDMKSRLPMNSPSVQSPTVAKLGKGNQSLVSNPNAFKAATPTQAIKAAPSTSPAASGSVAPATAAIAATPKPMPVAPRQTARERVLNQSYEYDAYDLVLEYLLNNGHVETVDEAHYVMLEMEAEVIQDIVKEVLDEDAKYDRNRRRAAQRAEARNAARDRGQTGAVPGVGYVTPRRENETYRDSAGVERHTSGARMPQKDK
jgi:hypothetical protein